MSKNLHIVFSERPDDVSDEEFNRWYDAHLHEILRARGFVSVQRYRLDPVVGDAGSYRYLAVYSIEGDPDDALAALAAQGMGSQDSYTALKEVDTGELELPEWFERAGFASWNCTPLGARVDEAAE